MLIPSAIFLIEGGKALSLIQEHISEVKRTCDVTRALMHELGVKRGRTDRFTGVLEYVCFENSIHPDFKKPNRHGGSHPKKGSSWAQRFNEQVGHKNASEVITAAFDIPIAIAFECENRKGFRKIGFPFQPCGFLWLSENGPYAMWVPDVEVEVQREERMGNVVLEPCASFEMKFDGCRRIEDEEWEILVLQNKLEKKATSCVAH